MIYLLLGHLSMIEYIFNWKIMDLLKTLSFQSFIKSVTCPLNFFFQNVFVLQLGLIDNVLKNLVLRYIEKISMRNLEKIFLILFFQFSYMRHGMFWRIFQPQIGNL
jgi:hypothetical protein